MNLLFLRGKADRPKEIAYNCINRETDMWTHLAYAMTREVKKDKCCVLYWGGKRAQFYGSNMWVIWVPSLKKYEHIWGGTPDVVFARGGFEETKSILQRYRDKFLVYYGAGKRFMPQDWFTEYNLVFVDSEEQKRAVKRKFPHIVVELIRKPATFHFFPRKVEKEYDICYTALIPEDERKRLKWVYKTCPPNLKVLQLGHKPNNTKVPKNFTVKYVPREKMPEMLCKCKAGIVPYTKDDSGPRIISELMACNIEPFILKSVLYNKRFYNFRFGNLDKGTFWNYVSSYVKLPHVPPVFDREILTVDSTAEYIKNVIEREMHSIQR